LEGDNFNESAINVKTSKLSDLIGKNGSCIRSIQDKTGVKISIPPHGENKMKVRVGLAGTPEAINETKSIINDIMTYYHSEATHPGVIHKEIDVPERMYNMIIGARGSEIKHIQNNYKVSVHIPNEESVVKNVLVVGQKNAVEGATKYIEKIVSNLNEEEANVMRIAEDWNEQANEEEADEPWMSQYTYKGDQKHSLISKEGADLLAKAQTTAWKDCTLSAEGW
jgi:polyribonucleotide nucleotidyltransferase